MTKNMTIASFSIDIDFPKDGDPNQIVRRVLCALFQNAASRILYDDHAYFDLVKLARLSINLVYDQEGWDARFVLNISECNCND